MPEFPHLSRAPIIEALMNFQTNAAAHWADEDVLGRLKAFWPAHTDVQALQQVAMQFSAKKGEPPKHDGTSAQTMGWIFRSPTEPNAHQVRRDGYTFSRLKPYENWTAFEAAALAGWKQYSDLLRPEPLHMIAVRFINKLEFPVSGFKLEDYFTAPPQSPPRLDWTLQGFVQHSFYAVPNSPCNVGINFSPAFSATPNETFAFMLDIEATLKQSLSTSGMTLEEVLAEMHLRKNEAFCEMLTESAINRYR